MQEKTRKANRRFLEKFDKHLRVVAKLAAADPSSMVEYDRSRCVALLYGEDEQYDVQLAQSAQQLFSGERSLRTLTKGLDEKDAALGAQMLAYLNQGKAAMHGPSWPDVDVLISREQHQGGPRGFFDILEDGPLVDRTRAESSAASLRGKKAVGVFFSGHWCPPSRTFTPKLVAAYDAFAKAKHFEIVFLSSDQTEREFWDYLDDMPWKALPFHDDRVRELDYLNTSGGIPQLTIVGADGQVITEVRAPCIMTVYLQGYVFSQRLQCGLTATSTVCMVRQAC